MRFYPAERDVFTWFRLDIADIRARRIHNALDYRAGWHGGAVARCAVLRDFRSYLAGVGGHWDGLGRGDRPVAHGPAGCRLRAMPRKSTASGQ
jgi:hypothetical protein